MAKKKVQKKKAPKKSASRAVRHEIVLRVQPQAVIPTVQDLAEPMQDGKNLTIPKTWLSDKQIIRMVQGTPRQHVYTRAGKGGQTFQYVTGAYVTKVLNFVFGWNWDFQIDAQGVQGNQVWVQGKLTVRDGSGQHAITKTQYGRADIKFRRDSKEMLDFGNDLKAATTDALKKCASLLGIASDIYGKAEYKEETNKDPLDMSGPQPAALPEPKKEVHHCVGPDGKGCRAGTLSIDDNTFNYSMKMFKKPLCKDCQKEAPAPWSKKK